MWEHTSKLPGRWLARGEVLSFLGISIPRFNLLVKNGWIRYRGKGNGRRFDALDVAAVGDLWHKLDTLFPEPKKDEEDEEDE